MHIFRVLFGALIATFIATSSAEAAPILRFTEWMYNGANGNEFIEITNVGDALQDLSGWSFSDNSRLPGNVSLTALGSIAPGESLIITERVEADFRASWGITVDVPILGSNSQNLGRADELNLYDAGSALVDRLTYNDAVALGGPRTLNVSGNLPLAILGLNQPGAAVLSFVGDSYGSIRSSDGDFGNPGRYTPVPEPAAALLAMMGLVALTLLRRRAITAAAFVSACALASQASATPYYIGVGSIPGSASDGSGFTATLEDGVTPGNRLGGFGSAIAYTGNGNLYIATPDRGPADGTTSYVDRYYTFDIQVDAAAHTVTPTLQATRLLTNESGQQLTGSAAAFDATNSPASRRFDPEGIRASRTGTFWVSDEYGPFVNEFDAAGQRLQSLEVPDRFLIDNPNANPSLELPPGNTSGRQSNRGMEGLAITPDGTRLLGAMQSPLIQDGALNAANGRVGVNTRLLEMNVTDGTTREFLYQLDTGSLGVSEILAISATQYLVLERDGRAGASAAAKRLYVVDIAGAADISGVASLPSLASETLPAGVTPLGKTLFLDLLDPAFGLAGASFPEKIEGLAFGPDLANGDHVLLVTSDNDFFASQASQIYAFGIPSFDLPGYTAQEFDATVPEPMLAGLLALAAAGIAIMRSR